ncbi:cupin domain-containing protein [Microvirga sp. BT688]|uniref:cupin domain-containing protein n=1 Tax=Microvirga sp. TaxID=1873136 RepID=UPI00168344E8|nr:cupin domain-containing protein [Microvirga sp.]MBD2748854.1 cupin domain-containing protein [Microvirga sp.]
MMKRTLIAGSIPTLLVLTSLALAQQSSFFVKPLAERKVTELLGGDLFWHLATFDTKDQAHQAAGPYGLVAEYEGKVWLFRLAQAGEDAKGGTKVAEIGPVPRIPAKEYLLRVNEAGGPQGSATAAHTHPGSEAFYVLRGELSQKTPHGITRLAAGQSMVGHGGDTPMAVSNSGSGDLREFALFIVDAGRPFSSPAQLD